MTTLSLNNLNNEKLWEAMDISLPTFNIEMVTQNTIKNPTWVHFGAGNIFRGFIANSAQKLLDENLLTTGIIAVDSFDYEVIDKIYKPYDNLSLLVLMNANGHFDKKVIASVTESLAADYNRPTSINRLEDIFKTKSLQMVSFTITEKGYGLKDPNNQYYPVVIQDIKNGPKKALHTMGKIAGLLYLRFLENAAPLTLVSMDNCSHNGDKLKNSVLTMANEWLNNGQVNKEFIDYLLDPTKITYPLSMIDKITPRPSNKVKDDLEKLGLKDMDTIITSKNSYMAPFVNAEICEYLVIEDTFTNGRPALEHAGVIFTDRDTVNKVETMKVTTCLNPLHTTLAVAGCLLNYHLIADEMKDPQLLSLVKTIGYQEGLNVVTNPGIIDPKAFIDEVLNERFANPFIPDTPQRIATDTSQKVAIRFGETIKSYVNAADLSTSDLKGIPIALALWVRYLMGVDDTGAEMPLSPDPLLVSLQENLDGLKLGDTCGNKLKSILSNTSIFGCNLYEVGLGERIESYFDSLNSGPGAVRATLSLHFS